MPIQQPARVAGFFLLTYFHKVIQCMGMSKTVRALLSDKRAKELLKTAGAKGSRLAFSTHAEERMKERRISRKQVLETLRNGTISEPLHKDVRGDWRCSVNWFYAGLGLTVAVAFKLLKNGEMVVVVTVYED